MDYVEEIMQGQCKLQELCIYMRPLYFFHAWILVATSLTETQILNEEVHTPSRQQWPYAVSWEVKALCANDQVDKLVQLLLSHCGLVLCCSPIVEGITK